MAGQSYSSMAVKRTRKTKASQDLMKKWRKRCSLKKYLKSQKLIRKSDSLEECETQEHRRQSKELNMNCITRIIGNGAEPAHAVEGSRCHIDNNTKIQTIQEASHRYTSTTASWAKRPSKKKETKIKRKPGQSLTRC